MLIHGRCHCGNIAYTLDWSPDPLRIPARACSCTFCRKHGSTWTSCPTGALEVTLGAPDAVEDYRFGTATAQFHVCRHCGVVPLASCVIDGTMYAVVNVNTMDDIDPALLDHRPVELGDEAVQARLARRAAAWIPRVVIRPR